jgi:polyhydroxyalkanoate synthase
LAGKKHRKGHSDPTAAANGSKKTARSSSASGSGTAKNGPNKGKSDQEAPVDLSAVEPFVVKDPEAMARNMAHVVEEMGKAAAAWVEPRERGEKTDSLAGPATDIVKTFSKLSEYWLSDPQRAIEAQTHLLSSYFGIWSNSMQKLSGEETVDPAESHKKDRRFSDEDWQNNAFFSFLRQAYWVTSDWADKLVKDADGLDPHTRHKAEFYVKQLTSALSPSNFILTNPEVYKETVAESGENLVRGMRMLAEDIQAGKGDLRLRQTDYDKFKVGENLAMTPGKVVAQSDVCQVIQYAPETEKVLKRPLLICPPWINKFYILDLNPQKSFIRWAVEQGHTVFVISWVNPDERQANKGWEAYGREGIGFALDTIEKATGENKVNAIGYCVGGTLLAATLALFAQEGDNRVASVTFFTTQVDFVHAGDLLVFADAENIDSIEENMKAHGYLDGSKMATAFNMLRASELIWPYVVNNYLKGKEPMPFDLLYWNSDATRMPAANHSYYLRNCYLENNLSNDRMVLDGKTISLKDVKIPVYNLATKEDHIAPARSVFIGCGSFGGKVTYVMSGSGHIAGVVNPPDRNKYQYWTGGKPVGEFDDWVDKAKEHPGSWWPHWQAWIEKQDKHRVDAREPGGGKLNSIEDAPGSFVRVRV